MGSGEVWLVDFLEGGGESAEVVHLGTIPPASHHTADYFSQSPKEIPTICTQRIHMSTIRVTDEVKERLRDLKRDDESFNDLLDRLSRSEKDVEEMAGFLSEFDDGSLADDMRETHEGLNESLDRRSDE
jgi:predicted CopG family antitoxin